jgi:hypothetical protein
MRLTNGAKRKIRGFGDIGPRQEIRQGALSHIRESDCVVVE